MKKTNNNEKYEQLTIDFCDEITPVELPDETPEVKGKKAKVNNFIVGGAVTVNAEVKRFCDGRGIPDYARNAYIKRINPGSKTIVIESEPNGKEYGLLFMNDVSLV